MSDVPPFPDGLRTATFPCISLAKLERKDELEAARLFKACVDFGCFSLDLRGIDDGTRCEDDIAHTFSIGKTFFDAPVEEKLKFSMDRRNVGYKPAGAFELKHGGKDEVEIYGLGKDRILDTSNNDIGTQFIRERLFLSDLIHEWLHPIALLVLGLIATHLDMRESALRELHGDDMPSATVLRFLRYPGAATGAGAGASDGDARLLGHTDNGSLTILFTTLGGLQVLPPGAGEDDASAWQWVRPEPGCAFINVGDSLVQWTGGVLRSVYHRVVAAPGAQAGCDRYSIGYFLKAGDAASMRRLREGLVPAAGEGEDTDVAYPDWHQKKSMNIFSGVNGVTRGGTATVAWKNQHLVEASS